MGLFKDLLKGVAGDLVTKVQQAANAAMAGAANNTSSSQPHSGGRGNFVADISKIAEDQKETYRKQLEEAASLAADMGVSKEECMQILDRVYSEKTNQRGVGK